MDPDDALLDTSPLSNGMGLAVVFVIGLPVVAYALWVIFRVVREEVRHMREDDRTRRRGFRVLPPGEREDQR